MSGPNLTPEQGALIARVVEIGIAYLHVPGEAHKQYGIEAMLTLLTGSKTVHEFRNKHGREAPWTPGESA